MSTNNFLQEIIESLPASHRNVMDKDTAHLVIHHNEVLGAHLVPGLDVQAEPIEDGVNIKIRVDKGTVIEKPVHMCFGMVPEEGLQKIIINAVIEEDAAIEVLAHCTFPNAIDITHLMDATIHLERNARYSYFERHIHGMKGGVKVVPKAKVYVDEYARFKTEFELIKGLVGDIDIFYEGFVKREGVMDMMARIYGRENDRIKINETCHLEGESSRGVLTSHIACRDRTNASVYNTLTATAPFARGHVDCKEIVQENARAKAVPIVEVAHPQAHVTHEAALGSVDSKQLQTLMSRGLTEDEATELIIQGLLN